MPENQKNTHVPYLIYCTPEGEIREEPRLQALAFGDRPLEASELIPLPDGVTLSMMPDRMAVGQRRNGERQVVAQTRGWAAAALLPIGYTRTLLPAYEQVPDTEPLPFFGYTAIAGMNGRLYVAAIKTDDPHKWHPRAFNRRALTRVVREKQAAYPNNRIIAQHAHCALDYSCPTASNLFWALGDGDCRLARLQCALRRLHLQAGRGEPHLPAGSPDLHSDRG